MKQIDRLQEPASRQVLRAQNDGLSVLWPVDEVGLEVQWPATGVGPGETLMRAFEARLFKDCQLY